MNYPFIDSRNLTRLDTLTSSRQPRTFGTLLGFFLATVFPSLAIGRLQHGSIKFQYDPVPQLHSNPPPTSINIYPPVTPVTTTTPSWESGTKPTTTPSWESGTKPTGTLEPTEDTSLFFTQIPLFRYPDVGYVDSPKEYLVPAPSETQQVAAKRSTSGRYLMPYRRNRFSAYNMRRRFPDYLVDYYSYDYPGTRLRNRKRTQGRRPIYNNYDYDYDYDSNRGQNRNKQQRRKNKNKNRRDPDYYSDEEFDNDVEPVTAILRPRQQQTTTPTESATTTTMTIITNGTTPSTTSSSTNASTFFGYGPYSGNENISITYSPPTAVRPVYGVPGYSSWMPSYSYDSPQHSFYYNPTSNSYPSSSGFAAPSSAKPYPSYGPPSTSYGVPNSGQTYQVPGQTTGQAQISPSNRASNFQSYQLPFSSWYGRSASHSDIVKRVQDVLKFD